MSQSRLPIVLPPSKHEPASVGRRLEMIREWRSILAALPPRTP